MIVFNIVHTESHPVYQSLEAQNLGRQYDFLRSALKTSVDLGYAGLSHDFLRALNFHAIATLHPFAGAYRPPGVSVTIGESEHVPPTSDQVPALMNGFIDEINSLWESANPIMLAAFALWRLNWVHPFVNGNGRTARAAAYFVVCRKFGIWFETKRILPELIRETRAEYVAALKAVDASAAAGPLNVLPLALYLEAVFKRQLEEGNFDATAEANVVG
jgi:Fic family protein